MAMGRLALTIARALAAQTLRRWAVTAGLWALALMCGFIGLMGLAAALWVWLAQMWGPVAAGLTLGLGGFGAAALLILLARFRRRAPSPLADLQSAVRDQGADVAVWAPIIGLALLGFLLGSGKKD